MCSLLWGRAVNSSPIRPSSISISRLVDAGTPAKAKLPQHPRPLEFLFFLRPRVELELAELANHGKFAKCCQILEGSSSAVSKPIFARNNAFCSIFQALQDLRTFAPLQIQSFSKKVSSTSAPSFRFSDRTSIASRVWKIYDVIMLMNFQQQFYKCCESVNLVNSPKFEMSAR